MVSTLEQMQVKKWDRTRCLEDKNVKGVKVMISLLHVLSNVTFISPILVIPGTILYVPYRWHRGDYRFPRRLSVCPSVCQSTRCPSTRFSEFFSVVLWDIDLKFSKFVMTLYRSSSNFVTLDQLLQQLLPFDKIQFSDFSLPSFEILNWN